MNRSIDWPIKLNAYLVEVQGTEFKLGEFDCCTFVAGAIEAMTGEDPMPEFRGKYDDWDSANKTVAAADGGTLYEILKDKFGEPVIGQKGQKGDIAFYEDSCGIVLGIYAIFLGANGLAYVRLRHLQWAFRIPY